MSTIFWIHFPCILNQEVWKSPMYMGANFLARVGRAKDANDWDSRSILVVGQKLWFGWQIRIQVTRTRLIVIDTIEPESKHGFSLIVFLHVVYIQQEAGSGV